MAAPSVPHSRKTRLEVRILNCVDARFFNSFGKDLAEKKQCHGLEHGVSVLAVSLRYFLFFPELGSTFRYVTIPGVVNVSVTLINEMIKRNTIYWYGKYHSF